MKLPHLTHCELELMDIIWRKGGATVHEVCESLKRPLAYTTIQTTLGALHTRKAILTREKRGRRHVYKPAVSREEVIRATIDEIWEPLFAARPVGMILSLINSGGLSEQDLQVLKDAIRELERRDST